MIFVTNSLGAVILLTVAARGGELALLNERIHTHPTAILWLLTTVVLAYGGSYAFTACIKGFGAVVATGVGICRKFVSVMASYTIFPKPFNVQHVFGILLFFAGMVLSWSQQASITKTKKPKRTSSSASARREMQQLDTLCRPDDTASSADADSDENLDSPTSSLVAAHGTPGTPSLVAVPITTRQARARWGEGEAVAGGEGDKEGNLAHAAALMAWSKGQKPGASTHDVVAPTGPR